MAEVIRVTPGNPDDHLARLLEAEIHGKLPEFLFFWGHTRRNEGAGPWVLSQWWPARFEVDSITYLHAEGFMMAEKARLFGDDAARARILAAERPEEAKRLGRVVHGFDDAVWEADRYRIVVRGNLAKFGQNEDLRRYLLSTAPRLPVEASPLDQVWGIGLAAGDERARRPSQWRGRNLLGFALADVRDLLAILDVSPRWYQTGAPFFPVAGRVDGAWWVLRVNSFPDHPLWTLFVDGVRRFDVDDAPPAWGNPAALDHPALTPAEASEVLAPVAALVAYGSEVGAACDNPFCCG